jgi:hypothetical protein
MHKRTNAQEHKRTHKHTGTQVPHWRGVGGPTKGATTTTTPGHCGPWSWARASHGAIVAARDQPSTNHVCVRKAQPIANLLPRAKPKEPSTADHWSVEDGSPSPFACLEPAGGYSVAMNAEADGGWQPAVWAAVSCIPRVLWGGCLGHKSHTPLAHHSLLQPFNSAPC